MKTITHNGAIYTAVTITHEEDKQAKIAQGNSVNSYDNGDYEWKKDGVMHLIRDGVEIAQGDYVYSYDNGNYEWRKDGVMHKITSNGKTLWVDGVQYERQ